LTLLRKTRYAVSDQLLNNYEFYHIITTTALGGKKSKTSLFHIGNTLDCLAEDISKLKDRHTVLVQMLEKKRTVLAKTDPLFLSFRGAKGCDEMDVSHKKPAFCNRKAVSRVDYIRSAKDNVL
jgi:hypothetical protein